MGQNVSTSTSDLLLEKRVSCFPLSTASRPVHREGQTLPIEGSNSHSRRTRPGKSQRTRPHAQSLRGRTAGFQGLGGMVLKLPHPGLVSVLAPSSQPTDKLCRVHGLRHTQGWRSQPPVPTHGGDGYNRRHRAGIRPAPITLASLECLGATLQPSPAEAPAVAPWRSRGLSSASGLSLHSRPESQGKQHTLPLPRGPPEFA